MSVLVAGDQHFTADDWRRRRLLEFGDGIDIVC
jgi:hypothetical protein